MKKQAAKITLKTDKVVSLSKTQSQNVFGGMSNQKPSRSDCTTKICSL